MKFCQLCTPICHHPKTSWQNLEEVSLGAFPQAEVLKIEPTEIELPNNDNKLYDEDDDQAASTMT